MTNVKALLASIAMFSASASHAERVNHDVTTFDIAGITLGMGSDEAIEKMTELTGVAFENMSTGYREPNPVTGNDEISYAIAETDDFEISVSFTAAVPFNEETPLVVSSISFQMPQTPDNMASMRARAFEKYGSPTDGSTEDPDHFDLAWCTIPEDTPTASCSSGVGSYLKLGRGMSGLSSVRELLLFDISYADAVSDFVNGENSSEPKF